MNFYHFPENSVEFYVMFGKSLNRRHQFRDCEVEVRIRARSKHHQEIIVGTFPVSNVISFKPTKIAYVPQFPDSIMLYIYLRKKESVIDSAMIDIEISSSAVYYSRIVNLAGEYFQVLYYVAGTSEREGLTISSDHPKYQRFDIPVFNIDDNLRYLGMKSFDNEGKT